VALVAGSAAFYPEPLLEEAVADAQRELSSYQLSAQEPEASMTRLAVKWAGATHELDGPSCTCKNCTRGSAKWVMDLVIGYIKEKCETTECPYIKEKCEMAAAHPKVAFGFIFGEQGFLQTDFLVVVELAGPHHCCCSLRCFARPNEPLATCRPHCFSPTEWICPYYEYMYSYSRQKPKSNSRPSSQLDAPMSGCLAAAVRPVSLGYAWCNGKGECGKEEAETPDMLEDEDAVAESLSQLQQLVKHESTPMGELVAEAETATGIMALEEGIDMLVDGETNEANSLCKGCIKVTSAIVMWDTIKKIKHYCHTTESEMVKKHCEMAKKHPQEAFGALAYKLRPGEWGCGYCFGNKMCGGDASADTMHEEVLSQMVEEDDLTMAFGLGEEEEVMLELPH